MENTPRERSPSPPRSPSAEWPELSEDGLIEEEGFSWYRPEKWLSVEIGQVFESRYQVLVKLGFGSVSTAWLCRDLIAHKYVTLKVYETGHRQALNENRVLNHLAGIKPSSHPGGKLVRLALDSFEVTGKVGPHVCIVHEPLSLSLSDIRGLSENGRLSLGLLKPMVVGILEGLDYLHRVAHVVHTDIQEGNVILSIADHSMLDDLVAEEWTNPSPRRIRGGRTVHVSTPFDIPDDPGHPTITDFGDAQFGDRPFVGEVMPDVYRAPENVLMIPWDEKIDIWALGLMIWDMFERKHLFNKPAEHPSRDGSAAVHLARMISLMGPPPPDLLERGEKTPEYFDENGIFRYTELVTETSLEAEEENLEGEEKVGFLTFMRKILQWRPEDRLSTKQLYKDPWLRRMVDFE